MLNEIYTVLEFNKEIKISSVDDIIGYVLNNQQDIITNNLQKYISIYHSTSKLDIEKKYFEGQKR